MGSYLYNGTGSFPDPTQTRYIERTEKGISGDAHVVYAAPRQFEMKWEFMSMNDFTALQNLYRSVQSTGTFVATIPQFGAPWAFTSYSGCTMKEPQTSYFFETYVSNVTVLILGIITL